MNSLTPDETKRVLRSLLHGDGVFHCPAHVRFTENPWTVAGAVSGAVTLTFNDKVKHTIAVDAWDQWYEAMRKNNLFAGYLQELNRGPGGLLGAFQPPPKEAAAVNAAAVNAAAPGWAAAEADDRDTFFHLFRPFAANRELEEAFKRHHPVYTFDAPHDVLTLGRILSTFVRSQVGATQRRWCVREYGDQSHTAVPGRALPGRAAEPRRRNFKISEMLEQVRNNPPPSSHAEACKKLTDSQGSDGKGYGTHMFQFCRGTEPRTVTRYWGTPLKLVAAWWMSGDAEWWIDGQDENVPPPIYTTPLLTYRYEEQHYTDKDVVISLDTGNGTVYLGDVSCPQIGKWLAKPPAETGALARRCRNYLRRTKRSSTLQITPDSTVGTICVDNPAVGGQRGDKTTMRGVIGFTLSRRDCLTGAGPNLRFKFDNSGILPLGVPNAFKLSGHPKGGVFVGTTTALYLYTGDAVPARSFLIRAPRLSGERFVQMHEEELEYVTSSDVVVDEEVGREGTSRSNGLAFGLAFGRGRGEIGRADLTARRHVRVLTQTRTGNSVVLFTATERQIYVIGRSDGLITVQYLYTARGSTWRKWQRAVRTLVVALGKPDFRRAEGHNYTATDFALPATADAPTPPTYVSEKTAMVYVSARARLAQIWPYILKDDARALWLYENRVINHTDDLRGRLKQMHNVNGGATWLCCGELKPVRQPNRGPPIFLRRTILAGDHAVTRAQRILNPREGATREVQCWYCDLRWVAP